VLPDGHVYYMHPDETFIQGQPIDQDPLQNLVNTLPDDPTPDPSDGQSMNPVDGGSNLTSGDSWDGPSENPPISPVQGPHIGC
jgi:hypothetical protein